MKDSLDEFYYKLKCYNSTSDLPYLLANGYIESRGLISNDMVYTIVRNLNMNDVDYVINNIIGIDVHGDVSVHW